LGELLCPPSSSAFVIVGLHCSRSSELPTAPTARDRWLERNGCDAAFDAEPVKGGSCEYYQHCPEHAQVVLCHFEEMGHSWAGGVDGLYGNSGMASAAQLAGKFWQDYAG
jgi:poly(3-hydroxybutyrate) depolymerase